MKRPASAKDCYISGMPHSCVRHDSFLCVACLIHVCDMTHSYVWHVSFMCATWLIHMYDTTHSRVRPDSCRYDSYVTQCDMGIFPQNNNNFSKNQFFKNNQPLPRSAPIPWVCETWHSYDVRHDSYVTQYDRRIFPKISNWKKITFFTKWPGSAKERSHSMSMWDMTHMMWDMTPMSHSMTGLCQAALPFHEYVRHDSHDVRHDSYVTQYDRALPSSAPIPWVCETWLIWCETWLVCHTVWPGSAKQRSHSMSLLAVMSPFFSVIHHTYVCM